MRGFRKRTPTPDDTGLDTLHRPEPGPGEVLVRVAACGICGSDLHAARTDPGYEWLPTPVVLGHELAGAVVATGPGVRRFAPDDGVVGVSTQGCGGCPTCAEGGPNLCPERRILGCHHDGGLAEYAVLAERHLVAVPPGLDLVHAALTEPLTVAVHAVVRRTRVLPGSRVVVSGPGTIGLFCALLARAAGATVVLVGAAADAALRLPLGVRLGLDAVDGTAEPLDGVLAERFDGRLPDAWIEASGAVPALEDALRTVRPGGQVTIVGQFAKPLTVELPALLRRELTVAFSYAATPDDYVRALDLLRSGAVPAEPLLTRFPLSEAPTAFAAAAAGEVLKAVIVP